LATLLTANSRVNATAERARIAAVASPMPTLIRKVLMASPACPKWLVTERVSG
jgi:hypothetical protein